MPRFFLPATLLATMTLAGCSTIGTEPVANGERTRGGAIVGAMLGGFLGATSGDDQAERAIVGAGIGAALGATIGQGLDRQARDLEQRMGNPDVQIVNTGEALVVTMPQDILFDIDSAALRADLRADLRALAANLQDFPDTTVEVLGHTDNTGSAEHNQALSARRAAAVSAVLFEQGVASSRVRTIGRGENVPIATNLNEDGRRQNRRVEIIIRPVT